MSQAIFRNYKGFDQLQIETVEDLERLLILDKARWAATSVPIEQLFCDPAFLAYMDTDKNSRIRVDEMLQAQKWLWERLKNRERIVEASDELRLSDLSDHQESANMKRLALHLLERIGAPEQGTINLALVRKFKNSSAQSFPNGDGIVTKSQIKDADAATFAEEIIMLTKGATDLSGEAGVRASDVDGYITRANNFIAWSKRGVDEAATLTPFGADTAVYAKLVSDLAPKITQFFSQCALVALEAAAMTRLQASPEELKTLDISNTLDIENWLAKAPLSKPNAEGILSLTGALNPRYAALLQKLSAEVAPKALGKEGPIVELTASQWAEIQGRFTTYGAYFSARPDGFPADADVSKLKERIEGKAVETLRSLIARDVEVADELAEFNNLEKLILLQCYYLKLANNFVSFPALFTKGQQTLFEMGTLVLDGRKMRLCVKVADKAAHKAMAEASLMFLVYFDIVRKENGAEVKASGAAAITSGVKGGIAAGKRGIFYDRDEKEWDAIVTDIVAQPISVSEAMFAPFTRLRERIAERLRKTIESKAESMETKATETTDSAAEKASAVAATAATAPVPPPVAKPAPAPVAPAAAPPAAGGGMQTLILGGGVVFAAIGSTLAFLINALSSISLKTLFGILGLFGALAALFGLLGYLKLRKRDISTLLEACGWALNGRMRLTHTHSLVFTNKPGLPEGAVRKYELPSGKARWVWLGVIIFFAIMLLIALLKPTFYSDLYHRANPKCGDGYLHKETEKCDDGNQSNEDSCSTLCKAPVCGDGLLFPAKEECDDKNTANTDACRNDCKNNVCGDGILFEGTEQCDDTNNIPGDGCDPTCKTEAKPVEPTPVVVPAPVPTPATAPASTPATAPTVVPAAP